MGLIDGLLTLNSAHNHDLINYPNKRGPLNLLMHVMLGILGEWQDPPSSGICKTAFHLGKTSNTAS